MYAENLISTPEAQADFYPTPKELGKKMLQGIDLGFISTVLEPSAGKGDLIRCLAEESIAQEHRYNPHTLNVDAIEIDPYIRSILKYEFGSARQQEIQHTLRGFEDRTRYDYKLDKEVGLNDEEKTARAQLRYESSLRDRIDLHIVHDDFLTFVSRKTYDLILMKLTSELRQKYYDMVGKLVNYDFTLFNIQQISLEMNAELSQGIQDTIFKLFERFTVEHSWYPETSKNVHYFNGWKANKAHKVNSKIILPVNGMFSDYSWSDAFEVSHAEACISDIEKVFDFLDGNMTSYVNLHGVLARAARAGQTRNIPCKYFDVTLYKKGTMHIRFHNEELLERFNIYCSRGKNWLPPNYGKRTYADMPQEEQAVIDSFHGNGEPASGKERYAEILAKRDYYLQAPKQDFPLLTN